MEVLQGDPQEAPLGAPLGEPLDGPLGEPSISLLEDLQEVPLDAPTQELAPLSLRDIRVWDVLTWLYPFNSKTNHETFLRSISAKNGFRALRLDTVVTPKEIKQIVMVGARMSDKRALILDYYLRMELEYMNLMNLSNDELVEPSQELNRRLVGSRMHTPNLHSEILSQRAETLSDSIEDELQIQMHKYWHPYCVRYVEGLDKPQLDEFPEDEPAWYDLPLNVRRTKSNVFSKGSFHGIYYHEAKDLLGLINELDRREVPHKDGIYYIKLSNLREYFMTVYCFKTAQQF